jgi:hypothetical protein
MVTRLNLDSIYPEEEGYVYIPQQFYKTTCLPPLDAHLPAVMLRLHSRCSWQMASLAAISGQAY